MQARKRQPIRGLVLFVLLSLSAGAAAAPIAIAVHGGAGTITKSELSADKEQAIRDTLRQALEAGYGVLEQGGDSVEAVIAAITVMEDSPHFNAGKGAVFNHKGGNELDASIMRGSDLNAGGVASLRHIKNPIRLARRVMTDSKHVLLVGDGAEQFAQEQGMDFVDPDYFRTPHRWQQYREALEQQSGDGDASAGNNDDSGQGGNGQSKGGDAAAKNGGQGDGKYLGTVGTVALDREGNLAAGTSTGGLTLKRYGRVGDSPIIGAGTYANNATCAVSATGHGEYFIRLGIAHEISALMAHNGVDVQTAAHEAVMEKLPELGGSGGVIALDGKGNIAMPFTTEGMYRGYIDTDGNLRIMIYGDE